MRSSLKFRRFPAVVATLLPLLLGGCYLLGIDHTVPGTSEEKALSAGYAQLAAILADQKTANQGSRNVPAELQALLDRIAGSALEFDATLRDYAKQNAWIQLDRTGLPEVDAARRTLDRQERRVDLLQQSGRAYERLVLLTQWRILTEERNLARAQAALEPDPKRKAFLTSVASRCADQRDMVRKQLDLRYFSPG